MKLYAGRLCLQKSAILRLRMYDRYAVHRVMLDLIKPERSVETVRHGSVSSGIQWVDRGEHLVGRQIDFLSTIPPMTSSIPNDVSLDFRELSETFLEHDRYRFQTIVNPVRFREGRRLSVVGEPEIEEWFLVKAERCGLFLENVMVDKTGCDFFWKNEGGVSRKIVFNRARVRGVFRVSDRELFKDMMVRGFGKGRAFGYGLMQIAAIN